MICLLNFNPELDEEIFVIFTNLRLLLFRPMKRVLCLLLVTIAACLAIAASRSDFESLSDDAAKKYTLPNHVGSLYAERFSDWSTEPMLHAMKVCESTRSATDTAILSLWSRRTDTSDACCSHLVSRM
jgi:hypothetical protein